IAMALAVLVSFYLLAFLGEQLARMGVISVLVSSLIPIAGSGIVIAWLALSRRFNFLISAANFFSASFGKLTKKSRSARSRNLFVDLTTGLRDFELVRNLLKNFVLTLGFLSAIFIIFTAFELWKFAGTIDGGVHLLGKYLFFLMPFVYLQIAPSAAMIGTLATYVIKSRQNEIVTWTSAGQSVYRLLMPCFLLMILLGGINWVIQERVLPRANQLQDATRNQIRNRGVLVEQKGKYWVANEKRIYSFEFASDNDKPSVRFLHDWGEPGIARGTEKSEINIRGKSASDNEVRGAVAPYSKFDGNGDRILGERRHGQRMFGSVLPIGFAFTAATASDNEKRDAACETGCVKNLIIYEFADKGDKLQFVYRADEAIWERGRIRFVGNVEKNKLIDGKIETSTMAGGEVAETLNPFAELRSKPNHLNTLELKRQIAAADSDIERRNLSVGLEKKYTTLFLPFVMALFTAPFSLSLSRKGKAATVGYAVGLWLLFTGTSSVFDQLGLNGVLPAGVAVWSPLVIFSLFGIYLLSKVRT
ncbi:MAG: LptF/LptG family permease, partial [Pyrinomonadaceae bacterium]